MRLHKLRAVGKPSKRTSGPPMYHPLWLSRPAGGVDWVDGSNQAKFRELGEGISQVGR